MNILLVTVGGSPQPILTAIATLGPDRVIFITSANGSDQQVLGAGLPCEVRRDGQIIQRLANLPTAAKLENFNPLTDLIVLANPDDLTHCYQQISRLIPTLTGHTLWADYTGGTKTMSLALGMAALDHQLQLTLTTSSQRPNIQRVERDEVTARVAADAVYAERSLGNRLPTLLQSFDYPTACLELQSLQALDLPPALRSQVAQLLRQCQAFDAWDRFDHAAAWTTLQHTPYAPGLAAVCCSRAACDPSFEAPVTGTLYPFAIVIDLCLNAARRAAQGRYDDAVGRLYRATELLAQIRLRELCFDTHQPDYSRIPEAQQAQFAPSADGVLRLGLTRSYELLRVLGDLALWESFNTTVRPALDVRNSSLFAHGFRPITATDYIWLAAAFERHIQFCVKAIAAPTFLAQQLPQTLTPQGLVGCVSSPEST